MQKILRSTYTVLFLIAVLLIFLFKGIAGTYAYTDGYEFLWNVFNSDFITVFIQQGRIVSGWITKIIYPHIHIISDLYKVRLINVACLFMSSGLIYSILKRNDLNGFQALAIVIIFICSPFASIVVHWEATSSAIWGWPFGLLSGELVFTAFLRKDIISPQKFNARLCMGILLALVSLFIYQPAYTASIFPAFVHIVTGQKKDVIKRFLLLHLFLYAVYFILFKILLNQMSILPEVRAGVGFSLLKPLIFIKGVLIRSLYYNVIFTSITIKVIVTAIVLLLLGYWLLNVLKEKTKKEKWSYAGILILFYVMAYFPNLISADNFVAYRTIGTVMLLSSFLLVNAITILPFKPNYIAGILSLIVIISITLAWYNNKQFTDVQSAEYAAVKNVIKEKLKQGYPEKVVVIRADEKFLVNQNLLPDVITDEFGKLSNTVHWVPEYFVKQEIYELSGNRSRVEAIEVTSYSKNKLPDSLLPEQDWVLDIEQIYLSAKAFQP